MRILEMVEQITQQANAQGGKTFLTPTGIAHEPIAGMPPGADPRWRPAPDVNGSLFQDPEFSLPTTAGPLTWRLYYDGTSPITDGPWGLGRRGAFPLRLDNTGSPLKVEHEDGSIREYTSSDGTHYNPVGIPNGDSLLKNANGTWDETLGDTGLVYHFPSGNYVSCLYRQTPQGLFLTYNYDPTTQRLATIQEPAGRLVTASYNADGKLETVQDWGNRGFVVMTYVGSELTEVWAQDGSLTRFRYDSGNRLTYIMDPAGFVTSYTYDYAGRVLTRSVAGNSGAYTYLSGTPAQTWYTDPLGHVWTYLTSGGYPSGKIDPLGNRETYIYSANLPQAFTNALGYTTTFTFNASGYRTGVQDPMGRRWTYARDSYGNVVSMMNARNAIVTYDYGSQPNLRQVQAVIDPLGRRVTFGYQTNGLPQSIQDMLGNRSTLSWSPLGVLATVMNARSFITTYLYDAAGVPSRNYDL